MATQDQLTGWRCELKELHESMMKSREQFMAWSEELAMIEGKIKTEEFRDCVAEIKKDLQLYRDVMKKLPKVEDFSEEELEKRNGKAETLLDIVQEFTGLQINLPRKVEKLHFLLKQPLQ